MDVDLNYMRAAIQCYEKEGFRVCSEKYPKVVHRTTISRYRKCVNAGHQLNLKSVFERTKERLVDRIVAEERKSGTKVGIRRVRELFNEVKVEPRMSVSNKICADALKRARMYSKIFKAIGTDGATGHEDIPVAEVATTDSVDDGQVAEVPTTTDWTNFNVQWSKVLLLGDSLTQFAFSKEGCWASILSNKLVRSADIVNRGLSGYNTKWYLRILPKILDTIDMSSVAAVTVFLGANDAALIECPSNQHVPVADYYDNLIEIVRELGRRGCDKDRIILMSPPPYDHKAFTDHRKANGETTEVMRSAQAVNFYVRACKRLADKMNLTFCDVNTALKTGKRPFSDGRSSEVLVDGLHLSPMGAEIVASLLEPLISTKICEFNGWSELRLNCPNWREVATKDLEMEVLKMKK